MLKGGVGNKTKKEIIIYQCDNADYQKANNNAAEGPVDGVVSNRNKQNIIAHMYFVYVAF